MADNKHKQLAKLMQNMLNEIDKHSEDVAKCLNLIQFHFYEKKIVLGRPLMTIRGFKAMTKSHYIGLQLFSPLPGLKNLCITTPWLGAIIGQDLIFPSQILPRKTVGWFVPWGVYIVYPEQNKLKLKENRQQALLYCPTPAEISKEINWFEKESASNTLTHQLLTICSHYDENELLKRNLQQDPNPLYAEAIKEWNDHSTTDDVAKRPHNLDKADFAPQLGETIELAYGAVLRSAKNRTSKHRQNLRFRYRIKLEIYMFKGLPWSPQEKLAFLNKLEANLSGLNAVPTSGKHGRWEQDAGIDCFTAANFIEHFVLKFISNPMDNTSGEIACILWILIWCAQSSCGNNITVEQVRNLTTKQINDDSQILKFKNSDVTISQGLHKFLICLRGKGSGKRALRLFRNVEKKELERALHDASKKILTEGAKPVLPAAFLVSPHLHPGIRICSTERQAAKRIRQLVPYRHMSAEILEILKNTISENINRNH